MHKNNVDEAVSPRTAAFRIDGIHKYSDEITRRYWRKIWKCNGGRKIKSLRTHRKGENS